MVQKSNKKSNVAVLINTIILVVMGAFFVFVTIGGADKVYEYSRNIVTNSDAPALCFEKETSSSNDGGYVCSTQIDENGKQRELTSNKDYAMFLQNQIHASDTNRAMELRVVIYVVGILATAASWVGAVIYWIHNRIA